MAVDRIQRELEDLKALRSTGPNSAGLARLRKALKDRVNVIAAKGAEIAAAWQSEDLLPELADAFLRLLDNPASDPQCLGKISVSKALMQLGLSQSDLFIRGLHHHQWESTWGGKVDTAGPVRATCALALVQCQDLPRQQTFLYLLEAMTEGEPQVHEGNPQVRLEAARAIEQMSGPEAVLLLRLKARCGDKEFRVTGQVFESLLQLEGAPAVDFISEFLRGRVEEVAEEAALALGACRFPEALNELLAEFNRGRLKFSSAVLLRAISSSRLEPALEFLLNEVRHARRTSAEDALHALELHRDSEPIVERVRQAIASREELRLLFDQRFAPRD